MQGEQRDYPHYMGSYLGCTDCLDVEEHINLVAHPVTRAQTQKRMVIFNRFLGDTASSEDKLVLSFK